MGQCLIHRELALLVDRWIQIMFLPMLLNEEKGMRSTGPALFATAMRVAMCFSIGAAIQGGLVRSSARRLFFRINPSGTRLVTGRKASNPEHAAGILKNNGCAQQIRWLSVLCA